MIGLSIKRRHPRSASKICIQEENLMKLATILSAVAILMVSVSSGRAETIDLSTLSCKQFLESGDDGIKMVLTWMDGWYKGDEDNAIIDTDVFVENAKKFGTYCGTNPNVSIVTAADEV